MCEDSMNIVFISLVESNRGNHQFQMLHQQPGSSSMALHIAICAPSYFNNENDEVLRKWNQLQAFWGFGKGKYVDFIFFQCGSE